MKSLLLALLAAFSQLAAVEAIEEPIVAISRSSGFLVIDVSSRYTFLPASAFQLRPFGMPLGKGSAVETMEDPLTALSRSGGIVVADASSLYTLLPDGTFLLRPHGISGRVLDGAWFEQRFRLFDVSTSPALNRRFVVVALQTWYNGIVIPNDYWRIVFSVSDGILLPHSSKNSPPIFDGWIETIEERHVQSLFPQ